MAQRFYTNVELMATPSDGKHLVNKKYVDAAISRKVKEPVKAVCGENVNGTYASGVLTPDDSSFIFDGVTINADDRVLLIGQTDATQNGIYVFDGTVFNRADDFDDSAKISANVMIPVQQGDANADVTYVLTNDAAPTLDSDSLAFAKFRASGEVNAVSAEFAGDGSATEFTVTHGLGTKNVAVRIVDKNTYEECVFNVIADTDNTIKVKTDCVLEATDEFIATVVG